VLYVSLSGGVVREAFVAALDARSGDRSALGVAWVLRPGGPVRIHVRAKAVRRPGRTDSVLAAVDTELGLVTPTTYGRPTRHAA
jgi:hypothetical protein